MLIYGKPRASRWIVGGDECGELSSESEVVSGPRRCFSSSPLPTVRQSPCGVHHVGLFCRSFCDSRVIGWRITLTRGSPSDERLRTFRAGQPRIRIALGRAIGRSRCRGADGPGREPESVYRFQLTQDLLASEHAQMGQKATSRGQTSACRDSFERAGEGIRTLDIHLGKVTLYH